MPIISSTNVLPDLMMKIPHFQHIHHQTMTKIHKMGQNTFDQSDSHFKKVTSNRTPLRTVQSLDQVRLPANLESKLGQRKRQIELVDLTADSNPEHSERPTITKKKSRTSTGSFVKQPSPQKSHSRMHGFESRPSPPSTPKPPSPNIHCFFSYVDHSNITIDQYLAKQYLERTLTPD